MGLCQLEKGEGEGMHKGMLGGGMTGVNMDCAGRKRLERSG